MSSMLSKMVARAHAFDVKGHPVHTTCQPHVHRKLQTLITSSRCSYNYRQHNQSQRPVQAVVEIRYSQSNALFWLRTMINNNETTGQDLSLHTGCRSRASNAPSLRGPRRASSAAQTASTRPPSAGSAHCSCALVADNRTALIVVLNRLVRIHMYMRDNILRSGVAHACGSPSIKQQQFQQRAQMLACARQLPVPV
jgi:hypothetical protein